MIELVRDYTDSAAVTVEVVMAKHKHRKPKRGK